MDEVILRFPTVAKNLFKEIDNEGLTKCKKVSKSWRNFINNQKDLWLRIIRLQYESPLQLWKLNGKILKNKANVWSSNDEWHFLTAIKNIDQVQKLIYIENITKNKALRAKNDGKVIQEDFYELWKLGKPDSEGYFTLEHPKVPKVVTAISGSSLEIKDPYEHLKAFGNLWNSVICKTSTENVKDIALAVQVFFGTEEHGKEQYPPHHVVAAVGSKELYEHVVNRTGQFNSRSTRSKSTALHYSSMFGNFEISSFIIANEDDKNPEDKLGITPLHVAATHGQLETCKLIMGNVTNKNPKNKKGDTPLHFAAQCSNFDICRFIIDNVSEINPHGEKGDTPLHWLAIDGNVELCKYIVENVTDKNPSNDYGVTPLHEAAVRDHLAICKLIVPQVKERNPRDNLGRTPLHYAAKAGNFGVINYMYDFVNDLQPLDDDGKTPQNYMEQYYENLKEKMSYFANQYDSEILCKYGFDSSGKASSILTLKQTNNDSENSKKPKAKSKIFMWKYYARNGKARKRTFVSRKRSFDFSDRNKEMKLPR